MSIIKVKVKQLRFRKVIISVLLLGFLAASVFGIHVLPKTEASDTLTKICISPRYILSSTNETFTINVTLINAYLITTYEVRVSWNPSVLEVIGYKEGPFPNKGGTVQSFFNFKYNNTAGTFYAAGGPYSSNPDEWMTGNGTLFEVTFNVTDIGATPLTIYYSKLATGTPPSPVAHNVVDGYFSTEIVFHQVVVDGLTFYVKTVSNSTVSNFAFNQSAMTISFNVSGTAGTSGYVNVTIPKELLNAQPDEWEVYIDTTPTTPQITENTTHTFIYINYTHTTHTISIKGTEVIPDFPSTFMLLAVGILIMAIAAFLKVVCKKNFKVNNKFSSF